MQLNFDYLLINYLQQLRQIENDGYHGLSTEFRNLDRFLYNFDKTTAMSKFSEGDMSCAPWDKAICLTLENCNINRDTPQIQSESNLEEEIDGELQTYLLRIESESLYKLDVCELRNADDYEIEVDFENECDWIDSVGEVMTLAEEMDRWKENFESDYEDDENVEHILRMVGKGSLDSCGCFADSEEGFQIVVMDEDVEEIETIDESDVKIFEVIDGYNYQTDFIEDDATRQMASNYLRKMRKNNLLQARCDDFGLYLEGWTWVNVQHGDASEHPVYELKTHGEFDPEKLLIIKNSIIDSLGSLELGGCSVHAITRVIYDGEELEQYECGYVYPSEGQTLNMFIKRDTPEDTISNVAYNMSTREKA